MVNVAIDRYFICISEGFKDFYQPEAITDSPFNQRQVLYFTLEDI